MYKNLLSLRNKVSLFTLIIDSDLPNPVSDRDAQLPNLFIYGLKALSLSPPHKHPWSIWESPSPFVRLFPPFFLTPPLSLEIASSARTVILKLEVSAKVALSLPTFLASYSLISSKMSQNSILPSMVLIISGVLRLGTSLCDVEYADDTVLLSNSFLQGQKFLHLIRFKKEEPAEASFSITISVNNSPRLCEVIVNLTPHPITLVCVYAPSQVEDSSEDLKRKQEFWDPLDSLIASHSNADHLLVLGDFNARLSQEMAKDAPGLGSGVWGRRQALTDPERDSAEHLVEFMNSSSLIHSPSHKPSPLTSWSHTKK